MILRSHPTHNQRVAGSSPAGPTNVFNNLQQAAPRLICHCVSFCVGSKCGIENLKGPCAMHGCEVGIAHGALCTAVTCVCGPADRHYSARVFGPHIVLDDRRSRKQAARVPELLQQASHAYFTRGPNAGPGHERVAAARGSLHIPSHRGHPFQSIVDSHYD